MSKQELTIADRVVTRIQKLQNQGELYFPESYCPENALKSAWLILQETTDRNNKPVLDVCTRDSIANCLLNMVIQGLNPAKKQCYFIAYGNKLTLQRSYFGSMYLAKLSDPNIDDIFATVHYANEEFETAYVRGRLVVKTHKPIHNEEKRGEIEGAYCQVFYKNGTESATYMTINEIKQAWRQSQVKPIDGNGNINANSTHGKFTAEMAKKTVINNACKTIINSSDDSYIARNLRATAAIVSDEIDAEANTIEIDTDTGEVVSGVANKDVGQSSLPPLEDIIEDDLP